MSALWEVYAKNIPIGVALGRSARLVESEAIFLSDENLSHMVSPHEDALVITTEIDGNYVKMILIDSGSFTVVLFKEVYLGGEVDD